MRKIIALFILFTAGLFAQQCRFAWLTDTHLGPQTENNNLRKIVYDINKKDFEFVIISGDITGAGSNADLDTAKKILDGLKVNYYIIPGNHDTKRSESCCTKFSSLWGDDKFNFVADGIRFLGFNTGIFLKGHGGHFSPESLVVLDSILERTNTNEPIIIVTHHFMDNQLDNWFEVTNRVKKHNVIAILCGHGHTNAFKNIAGIPAVMGRTTLQNKNGRGYCSVTINKDSMYFYEEKTDSLNIKLYTVQRAERNHITETDSVSFINYNTDIVNNIKLNKTIPNGHYADKKHIAVVTEDGTIYCISAKGEMLWNYKTGMKSVSAPVILHEKIYTAFINGNIFINDCKTGKIINKIKLNEIFSSHLATGKISGNNLDVLFAGTADGKMYCLDAESLKTLWINSTAAGLIEDDPLICGGRIFYGSWDSYFNCVDITTGKTLWRWQGENKPYISPAGCRPVTDGKRVFIAAPDGYLTAIDLLTGKTVWRNNSTACWESVGITQNKKYVLVKGTEDKFYFVNPEDGKIKKSLSYKNKSESMCSDIIDYNSTILFTTQKGCVYGINKENEITPLLFLGTVRVHSVKPVDDGILSVSGMDGRIVLFKLKKDTNEKL